MNDGLTVNTETGTARAVHEDTGVAPPASNYAGYRANNPSTEGYAQVTIGGDGGVQVHAGGDYASAEAGNLDVYKERGQHSVVASAHTADGMSPAHLTPDTRIYLDNGMETTLGAAEALGLVARNGDGSYRDVRIVDHTAPETVQNEPEQPPEQAHQEGPADVLPLLQEAQQVRAELEATLVPGSASAMVADYLNGKLDRNALARHLPADQPGVNGERAAEQAAYLVANYEAQGMARLQALGMDMAEAPGLAAFCQSGVGKELALRVFNDHVTRGKVGGYKTLLDAFRSWRDRS